jgi:hypothetical protein
MFRHMPASIPEIDVGVRDRGDFSKQVDSDADPDSFVEAR